MSYAYNVIEEVNEKKSVLERAERITILMKELEASDATAADLLRKARDMKLKYDDMIEASRLFRAELLNNYGITVANSYELIKQEEGN